MRYCLALLMIFASFNSFATTYKWVDEQGKLHVQDTPPPASVKAEKLHTPNTSGGIPGASAPAAAPTIYERAADLNKEKQAREDAAKKAAQEKEQAEATRKYCESARNQLAVLQNSPRLVSYNANGEPSVMSDEARQKQIAEAQDAISKSCK